MKKSKNKTSKRPLNLSKRKITHWEKYIYEWNLCALVNIYGRKILEGGKNIAKPSIQ